ncbi:MAG TPA: hypothetical protein PLY91_07605 [Methanoregulaceae archaeon]|nr:hypothetical protein [Methanoregulaceae archaeon]
MLNRDKVIESFHQLGFAPRVEAFEDRILIQKCVLLLQLGGLGTTYPYRLHIRGPYCVELNREAFAHRAEFEAPGQRDVLDEKERAIVAAFGETFELRPNQLEVAATYAYFVSCDGLDPVEAHRRTRKLKSFVPAAQQALGISRAKRFLYPPTEEEMREMKDEFALWQSASLRSAGRDHE